MRRRLKFLKGKWRLTARLPEWWGRETREGWGRRCHRVVFGDGRPAPGYAFGGSGKQREKLEQEGIKFTQEGKVNLKEYQVLFPVS